ncbi:Uncharacterised protein [Bordetella pertussis]|nr:Uncharacterised protein [Bordetella pertussis]CFU04555.1 Uncharacterised protein [Bordetella pertussis]CFW08581.1 Uncharacterised protein [Bordetella pertussis]
MAGASRATLPQVARSVGERLTRHAYASTAATSR